jgi:hypothetical protein
MDHSDVSASLSAIDCHDSMLDEPEVHNRQLVEQKTSVDAQKPLLWSALPDAAVVDDQLFSVFYETYLPGVASDWRQLCYLHSLVASSPTSDVLKRAKRTIGLAYLATRSRRTEIAHEAWVSYGRLLGILQFSLQLLTSKIDPCQLRELVASIALTTHLSDAAATAEAGADEPWVTHLMGAQQLLSVRGPSSLNGTGNPLDKALIRHALMNGFWVALARRKTWVVNPAWFATPSAGWTDMVGAYYELPGLLEKTDITLRDESCTTGLINSVKRLSIMTLHGSELWKDVTLPPTQSVASLTHLTDAQEEHSVMSEAKAFPYLFVPQIGQNMSKALQLLNKFLLLLITACTVLRIWHFRPSIALRSPPHVRAEVERSAGTLARNLCMLALSFTQMDELAHALSLRLCLAIARNVFEQQQAFAELGWCEACLVANQMRVERLKASSAPTLCKVEQVLPGLAEAGRYGSRLNPAATAIRSRQSSEKCLLAQ